MGKLYFDYEGSNWQVKRIIVNSGGSLSLQKHLYRSENWVVVDGTALVEIEGKELINKNQSAYIPIMQNKPLILLKKT